MSNDDITAPIVAAGYKRMASSSVCICALARDCAPALSNNLSLVDMLGARFKSANVVIVENDSKDNSKEMLRVWAADRPHIKLLLDDFGTKRIPDARSTTFNPSFSRYRIEKLAFHRNRYLDHVATLPDLDYVIVIDLDLYRIDIDGIAQAFGQTIPWDAQFANGRISDPCRPELGNFYFDTYALWELGDSDPQTETKITGYWQKLQPLTKGMPLFAVQSAYGGLGIYRWEALKGQRYGVEDNPGDSRVEVITEHVYLHRRMIEAGNGRLFINPSMMLFYNKPRSGIALRVEKVTSRLADQGFARTAQKIARKMVSRLVQE